MAEQVVKLLGSWLVQRGLGSCARDNTKVNIFLHNVADKLHQHVVPLNGVLHRQG